MEIWKRIKSRRNFSSHWFSSDRFNLSIECLNIWTNAWWCKHIEINSIKNTPFKNKYPKKGMNVKLNSPTYPMGVDWFQGKLDFQENIFRFHFILCWKIELAKEFSIEIHTYTYGIGWKKFFTLKFFLISQLKSTEINGPTSTFMIVMAAIILK